MVFPNNKYYYSENYVRPQFEAFNSSFRFNGEYIQSGPCEYTFDDAFRVKLSVPLSEMKFIEKKWFTIEWQNRALSLTSIALGAFSFCILKRKCCGNYPLGEGALKVANIVISGASCKYFHKRGVKAYRERQSWKDPLPEIAESRVKCLDPKKGISHLYSNDLKGKVVTASEISVIYQKMISYYSTLFLKDENYSLSDVDYFNYYTANARKHLQYIHTIHWRNYEFICQSSQKTREKLSEFFKLNKENQIREEFRKDFNSNKESSEAYDENQFLKNFMQKEIEDTLYIWKHTADLVSKHM